MNELVITLLEDDEFPEIYSAFRELEEEKEFRIIINTDGGNSYNLLALSELMVTSKAKIHTHILGRAHSSGAVLAACGKIGFRTISPLSSVMLHNIQFELPGGGLDSHQNTINDIRRHNNAIYELMAAHCKKPDDYYLTLIRGDKDLYLTPEQAVYYGICDKVELI